MPSRYVVCPLTSHFNASTFHVDTITALRLGVTAVHPRAAAAVLACPGWAQADAESVCSLSSFLRLARGNAVAVRGESAGVAGLAAGGAGRQAFQESGRG